MDTNRELKDGVFKLLFEKPKNAAELYYALTGVQCNPDEIKIITLETAVSGKLKNDLAFIVDNRALIITEHQSTPNQNMPVRILMYLGLLYDKWFSSADNGKLIYSTALYKIPRPRFAVFYNGTVKRPGKEILKLSTAFEEDEEDEAGSGYIELEVPVYNINKGMGSELVNSSNQLRQYSEFVAKLRENQGTYKDFDTAVKETVTYCIANNILAEFLKEQGGKIVSIMTREFDMDMAMKVWKEEAREEGKEEGREEGREKERAEIAIELLSMGLSKEQVSRATKLSIEEILEIESDYELRVASQRTLRVASQ